MILPIGPIHPALKEPIRLKLQTEGERVVKAEIEYGYVHRGIEKIIEGLIFTLPALPRGNYSIKLDSNSLDFNSKTTFPKTPLINN